MALAFEGANGANASTTNTATVAITTSGTDRIVVVTVHCEKNGERHVVSSVTMPGKPGITFARRKQLLHDSSASALQTTELWWAYAHEQLTAENIVVTLDGNTDDMTAICFAVSGVDETKWLSPWDRSTSLPYTNSSTSSSNVATQGSLTTLSTNSVAIGIWAEGINNTGNTPTTPSGWSIVSSQLNSGGINFSKQYVFARVFSSAQTSTVVDMGSTANWGMIIDAISGDVGPPLMLAPFADEGGMDATLTTHAGPSVTSAWSQDKTHVTLSNSNKTATTNAALAGVKGDKACSNGKLYFELTFDAHTNQNTVLGLCFPWSANVSPNDGSNPFRTLLGTPGGGPVNPQSGTFGFKVDFDDGTFEFTNDGTTWFDNGGIAPIGPLMPYFGSDIAGEVCTFNGGSSTFVYGLPSGFTSWDDAAGAIGGAHAYWRIYVEDNNNDSFSSIGEIYLYDVAGTDVVGGLGGTPIESGHSGSDVAANAFNRVDGNRWAVEQTTSDTAPWVGMQFPFPVDVRSFAIKTDTSFLTQAIKRFALEYSDDGVHWRTSMVVDNQTGWSNLETRTYTRPEISASGYWAIRCLDTQSAGAFVNSNYVEFTEIEMRQTVGGADATGSGTAFAWRTLNGTPAQAFDNDTGTRWQADAQQKAFVGYNFGSPITIAQITLRNRDSEPTLSPINFDLCYSQDGIVYTCPVNFSTTADWGAGETRAFAWTPFTATHLAAEFVDESELEAILEAVPPGVVELTADIADEDGFNAELTFRLSPNVVFVDDAELDAPISLVIPPLSVDFEDDSRLRINFQSLELVANFADDGGMSARLGSGVPLPISTVIVVLGI